MSAAEHVWPESAGSAGVVETGEGEEVVQVVLSWCGARAGGAPASWSRSDRQPAVLAVAQVAAGGRFALGERGDALVPEEVLGAVRFEVVRHDGATAVAIVPPGARLRVDGWPHEAKALEIVRGHVMDIELGAFVVRLARVRAARRPASAPLRCLRGAGAGCLAGSALVHAAAFAVVALFAPALGATEGDPFDPDRVALIRHLVDASAQREAELAPDDAPRAVGGGTGAGAPARGTEGEAGKHDTDRNGRWAARGTARSETAALPRDRVLAEAASYGTIGILASLTNPDAPTVRWGTVLDGSDDASEIGHLFGATIDDAAGSYGGGLSGPGEAGGGQAKAIGVHDIVALGHAGLGTCLGTGPSGEGPCDGASGGYGRWSRGDVRRGYTPHVKEPRYETVETSGHLPAEVIQRIVRQNDGRYRFCYQKGLEANPTLQGRVTVKFLIDRHGAVAFAADAGSDLPDENVRRCVVSSFTTLSFPEPDSGVVTVIYPIVFSPK
jgi:hypothetical protein